MKCAKFKSLLYLYGEGELTQGEKKLLKNHLVECESCSAEAKSISVLKEATDKINKTHPAFVDEEDFTIDLMNEIGRLKVESNNQTSSLLDKMFLLLSGKQVRLALISMLLLIITSFFYETTVVVSGIASLEDNVAKVSSSEIKQASINSNGDLLKAISELYNLYSDKQEFAGISSEWILIKKESLKKLLSVYGRFDELSSEIPQGFEKEYPEVYKFIMENRSNKTFSLPQENKKFLNELERILDKGENYNVEK